MDETAAVRELLDIATRDEDAPPCRVSVELARRRGRRRLRLLRLYLPGAAPIAAAVAVALVLTLPASLREGSAGGPGLEPQRSAAAAPVAAPRNFNPLVPFASFGWLPAGFSVTAASAQDESTPTSVTLQALAPVSDGRVVNLAVDAAGACRVGPARSVPVPGPSLGTLTCAGSQDRSGGRSADLVRVAPDVVNGRPAYWTDQGALDFQYAAGAWAEVMPMANPSVCVHCAPNNLAGWQNVVARPAKTRHGRQVRARVASPQSAASRAVLVKIATSVHYGDTTPLLFGFRLAVLPPGWQVAADYYFVPQSGRLLADGLSAGPPVDPSALSVGVGPAVSPGSEYACKVFPGQTSHVTLDGAAAVVRYLNEPDKQFQSLCANDIDGVSPYVGLDLNRPGSSKPLPGGPEVSSVLTVFQTVHLLGPNPSAWVTDPLG